MSFAQSHVNVESFMSDGAKAIRALSSDVAGCGRYRLTRSSLTTSRCGFLTGLSP